MGDRRLNVNATLQALLVFAIVATALSYAVLKLMPRAWRQTLAAWAATMAVRSGFSDVQARRVEAKLASGGACGSCDSCRACATPTSAAALETAGAASGPTYRKIPIRTST